MFVYGDVVMLKIGRYWPWKTVTVSSHLHMPVRPTLLHRMALVSFLLFRKNLGNLREFFGQIVYRPLWQKIARTPMSATVLDPFAQLFQHCGSHARSLRLVYKDLWVVSFPRCTAGPNIVGSCCIRLHTTANTHATMLGVIASVCTQPYSTTTSFFGRHSIHWLLFKPLYNGHFLLSPGWPLWGDSTVYTTRITKKRKPVY